MDTTVTNSDHQVYESDQDDDVKENFDLEAQISHVVIQQNNQNFECFASSIRVIGVGMGALFCSMLFWNLSNDMDKRFETVLGGATWFEDWLVLFCILLLEIYILGIKKTRSLCIAMEYLALLITACGTILIILLIVYHNHFGVLWTSHKNWFITSIVAICAGCLFCPFGCSSYCCDRS
jgi:hypothetical protein